MMKNIIKNIMFTYHIVTSSPLALKIVELLLADGKEYFFFFGFVKSRYNYLLRNAVCTLQER